MFSRRINSVPKQKLARISITVPETTLQAMDQKIVEQHYESRSQAIVDMINRHLIDELAIRDEVMVGTLTLLYDVSLKPLRSQLVDLQQQYLAQVINSLHIQLADEKILQVMLMQGASSDLKEICEQFIALKGVIKGHLELMDAVMPPIPQNTEHT
jgi:CopG family nickel-responsive transcriptional regulator